MWGDINIIAIFTTGLLAGGVTCMAVQGGLLATILAKRGEDNVKSRLIKAGPVLPILSFLLSKVIAYTVFGAFLGWLGGKLQLSLQVQIVLLVLVAIFMLGTALNMLKVHPVFRYFVISPPRFLTRTLRKQVKKFASEENKKSLGEDVYAPALLGAFTIFIPCGVTQAMMALAIGTGSPAAGAMVMFAFTLGTTPIFYIFGYLMMKLSDVLKQGFVKLASILIIVLALFTLNSAIALTGSLWTFENILKNIYCVFSYCETGEFAFGGGAGMQAVSEETIVFEDNGYSPNIFAVKAGSEVTLHLKNENGGGCVQAFTIPALGIQKVVPINSTETIRFTAPVDPGRISFMCSMGMYSGIIEVI